VILRNKDVTLRYIIENDIEDYIRWTTTETEWGEWDAPWEDDDSNDFVDRQRLALKDIPQFYSKLEIDDSSGQHIGWVSSYYIDGSKEKMAVGIDIPLVELRGKGYGESALSCFLAYLFNHLGHNILYAQTWSGNIPMLRLAEKVGFVEIERVINLREVQGGLYDALTFSISRGEFYDRYPALREV